ncbi:unnamed protein product, partial [Pocillopora meandrina]
FSIIHFNTRSLIRNFDQLNLLLRNLNMPFSVVDVSETWLTDCTAEHVNIRGYNFVSNHRKSKAGGGVGIYSPNGLEYKLLEECKYSDPDVIESLFLEIIVPHGKNFIVDFNLDLLQYNHHVPTQEFIDSLFSHAFLPLISNPTRLTSYSATLIDNIFTNNLAPSVYSGIILNDLSDHLPVF